MIKIGSLTIGNNKLGNFEGDTLSDAVAAKIASLQSTNSEQANRIAELEKQIAGSQATAADERLTADAIAKAIRIINETPKSEQLKCIFPVNLIEQLIADNARLQEENAKQAASATELEKQISDGRATAISIWLRACEAQRALCADLSSYVRGDSDARGEVMETPLALVDEDLSLLIQFDLAAELERVAGLGFWPNVIYDDNGNWAIADEGMTKVRTEADVFSATLFGESEWFKPTMREAWECYLQRLRDLGNEV